MIFMGLIDSVIGGVILLVYFGVLPVDISALDTPHWIIALVGAIWFFSGLGVLVYQLSRTDLIE